MGRDTVLEGWIVAPLISRVECESVVRIRASVGIEGIKNTNDNVVIPAEVLATDAAAGTG